MHKSNITPVWICEYIIGCIMIWYDIILAQSVHSLHTYRTIHDEIRSWYFAAMCVKTPHFHIEKSSWIAQEFHSFRHYFDWITTVRILSRILFCLQLPSVLCKCARTSRYWHINSWNSRKFLEQRCIIHKPCDRDKA